MSKYAIDIAPRYGHPSTGSLTDGRHGCTVTVADMEAAIVATKARAKRESWPSGDALITEINDLGHRVDGPGHYPRRIKI